jgi:hypothetical protein
MHEDDMDARLGTATDALVDSYVAWREASAGVQAAYERWEGSTFPHRDTAFGDYMAALQREHHAARIYGERIELLRRVVGPATVVTRRAGRP